MEIMCSHDKLGVSCPNRFPLSIALVIGGKRKRAQMSQLDLAKASNIPMPTIVEIEGSKQRPTIDQLMAIAKALNISPFTLTGESIDKTSLKLKREIEKAG